ncbi:MAG: hypothetical protein QM594_16425 [Niabella sp.]
MMNYIDIKVTIWNRLSFSDDTNMKEIAKLVEQLGLDEVIDEARGFIENEPLYETEKELSPEDNNQRSTIEIYEQEELIWTNGPGQ